MIKLLKNLTTRDWLLALISFVLIVFQVWLDLKMPDYMSEITVLVQTEGSDMKDILLNGGGMLLCAFGSLVAAIIVGYLISIIAADFSKKVRKKLFTKVQKLGLGEVKKFQTSSLITRTTNDITQVEMLIAMGLQLLVKAPITAIWAITKILNKSWEWSALTGIAVIILLTTIGIIVMIVMPRFKIVQKLTDKLNGVTRENITGIRVVRAFNAEKYEEEKFNKVNTKLTKTQLFNQKTFAILIPIMYLVMYFLTLAIYFVGAHLIKDSLMADKLNLFGDMIVFSSYAMQVIMSFLMLAMIFMILPRAGVSAKRINEVLDTKETIKNGTLKENKTNETGTVEFKNVSFKYPDAEEYLLKNNDIIFVRSNGSKELVGRSLIVDNIIEDITYSGFCIRYRNKSSKINPKFLINIFQSKRFFEYLKRVSGGTNINNINQQILSSLKIILPRLEEQEKFIDLVEKLERKNELLKIQLKNYKNLKKCLEQKFLNKCI